MKILKKNIIKNEIWAFIPARSGSKSIKNKNLKKINGKPLIYFSLAIAKKIKKINKIIFSSDSIKYLNIASKYGNVEMHLRSKKNSSEKATDYSVFKEYCENKINKNQLLPEFFLHLRPTTPLRKISTVNKIINFFIKNSKKYSALRSVSELENSGFRTVVIKNNKLYSLFFKSFKLDIINNPRQSFERSFIPNGYADVIKTENLNKNLLHGSRVYGYITKEFNSDIDNIDDFNKTKNFLKY